ncbi:MAG: bifunctional riboflavin kinase/FAD synthetase, partial [Nitrospinota bacterium]|nr:bifunctional riboflavin kinase/FAD synthetase [Nitrospinota bacterium]
RGLRNLKAKPAKPVVTLGNFDGAHLGHQAIFRRAVERASEIGGTPVVYTFDPHPLKLLSPGAEPSLLCTFKKKMELLAACGISMTVCADFTRAFAAMHPRDFAVKLSTGLDMDTVVVGFNYSFGQGRAGSIDYLKKMGQELGFRVEVIEPVTVDGERVSSSLIRRLLESGDVEKSARLLDRYYSVEGKVVAGHHRGGSVVGFPTANLKTPSEVIPAVGVYAVFARVAGGEPLDGVVNVGLNPTFDRDDLVVETHLLDAKGDMYGAEMEIFFLRRLRDEEKFESVEKLREQISADTKRARDMLSKARGQDGFMDNFTAGAINEK